MAKVRTSIVVPGSVAAAQALWYDCSRWPSFVDGFAAVVSVEGQWPEAGAVLAWDSTPAGRGRVLETVTAYEPLAGQSVRTEDEKLSGVQRVEFAPEGEGATRVTLSLEYSLKGGNAFTPIFDVLFVRRPVGESLRRTVTKFARERHADVELSAA